MPRIRDKIWIDTTKSDQVKKHPKTAFLQKWRNKLLIWKNENINLESASDRAAQDKVWSYRGSRTQMP